MNKLIIAKCYLAKFQVKAGLLIALTALLYGLLLNNINLWSDEIYSVLMANDSFKDMFHLLFTEDSKPPLYYLYLKFILALFPKSYEIFGAHFASFILLLGAQIFAATAIRRDYGDKVALWMIVLLLLMPHSLWLAFEVRTYMLSALLMLMALVYGLRLLDKPTHSDFFKFALSSLLALYTHYYCALWLMFLYGYILFFLVRYRNFLVLKKFLWGALIVALLFAPWLYVPYHTAPAISKVWYVTSDFVKMSTQFFTNPLVGDMVQSIFHALTVLSVSALSFSIVCGIFSPITTQKQDTRLYHLLRAAFFSVLATYFLLYVLSVTVRPMVTSRYMLIFSLIWFVAGAVVLSSYRFLQKGFLILAFMGFFVTYGDIRAASFDKGYSNLVHDIRLFVPTSSPILTLDNNNLFCEYYLPEYTCLALVGKTGEILRVPSILKNIERYYDPLPPVVFALASYKQLSQTHECINFQTYYRKSYGMDLCKIQAQDAAILLQKSLTLRLNKY